MDIVEMPVEERAQRLVGDMPWVTEHLTPEQLADLPKQIQTSMEAAVFQEVRRWRNDYIRACQTTAEMHAAAVGEVRGPIRGVVEDVADLRDAWERLARVGRYAL